jgi:hypothetical protein
MQDIPITILLNRHALQLLISACTYISTKSIVGRTLVVVTLSYTAAVRPFLWFIINSIALVHNRHRRGAEHAINIFFDGSYRRAILTMNLRRY